MSCKRREKSLWKIICILTKSGIFSCHTVLLVLASTSLLYVHLENRQWLSHWYQRIKLVSICMLLTWWLGWEVMTCMCESAITDDVTQMELSDHLRYRTVWWRPFTCSAVRYQVMNSCESSARNCFLLTPVQLEFRVLQFHRTLHEAEWKTTFSEERGQPSYKYFSELVTWSHKHLAHDPIDQHKVINLSKSP